MSKPEMPHSIRNHLDADTSMDAPLGEHTPTGIWTYRIPTPSRIVVPPPHLNLMMQNTAPLVDLNDKVLSQEGIDISFLNQLDYSYLFEFAYLNSQSWTYAMRREASEVLPFLYLGPLSAARETSTLQQLGITMLLAIQHRSSLPNLMLNGPIKAANELGIELGVINVADNLELIGEFPRAARMINEHLVKVHAQDQTVMPKILLFCESGNDRSAAVAAAYLMQTFDGVDLVKACQIVNVRRFSANVEEGMKQYLLSYQQILQAQRDTRSRPRFEAPARKRHRSLEADDDMMEEEDAERFLGRDSAPFIDSQPT